MRSTDIVTAIVEVAVDPATAFAIFTEEIGQWWRPGPINWNDSKRAIGIRIEPGVGGRWLEVYDNATGEGFECGRIVAWEPGERLVFLYRDAGHNIDDTEVEIRFEAIDDGTRVRAPSPRVASFHSFWRVAVMRAMSASRAGTRLGSRRWVTPESPAIGSTASTRVVKLFASRLLGVTVNSAQLSLLPRSPEHDTS